MYERVKKPSSSWTPQVQKKTSKLGRHPFKVQPKLSQEPKEMPAYTPLSTDWITNNPIMRSLETASPQEEVEGEDSAQLSTESAPIQRQEESAPSEISSWTSPINWVADHSLMRSVEPIPLKPQPTTTVQTGAEAGTIQRLCSECEAELAEEEDKPPIQTKLTVGAPGDPYEQEADRVATQVMSMSAAPESSPQVQRWEDEDSPIQRWFRPPSITHEVQRQLDEQVQMHPLLQRAFQGEETPASGDLESRLNASKGGGNTLAPEVRAFMEPRFGSDFSSVRVHTGSESVQMNRELGAQAFTHGSDIYFGAGKSPGNNELTAHELTHVVQQTGGVQLQHRENEVLHRKGCGCPACSAISHKLQRQSDLGQSRETDQLLSHELTPVMQQDATLQRSSTNSNLVSHRVSGKLQRSFWGSIKNAFKKVGSAISNTAEKAWNAVKTGAEEVWGGIKTAAGAVWNGVKWVSSQLWSKLTGIFERLANWIKKLPERVSRLLLGLWEGVKSLKPWSLSWWESLGQVSTWEGVLKWLGTRLIDLLEIAGIGEVYETVMDFIKFNTRPLTGEEIAKAQGVFGSSINYSLVRVDEAAILGPSWTDRPYTSFHTINSWGKMDDHTLIHELTHVWQYDKAGAIYMPQAIHAQNTKEGYDYGGVPELQKRQAAGQGFLSFNREQQAQLVADYYAIKTGLAPSSEAHGAGVADLPLYEHFMADVRR